MRRLLLAAVAALGLTAAQADDITLMGVTNAFTTGGGGATYLTAPIFYPAGNAANGATYYQVAGGPIVGGGGETAAANADIPLSTGGTLKNFCVTSSFTGTSSNYWVYTVTYDDVDQSVTVNTNSITAGTPVCDTTHTLTYAAGHKLTVHKTATGSPTNDTVQFSYLMTDTAGQYGTIFIAPGNATNSATSMYIGNGATYNPTENLVSMYVPVAGHIDNLYTNVVTATASQFWTFQVQHDTTTTTPCDTQGATSLQVAYGSGTNGVASDTTSGDGFDVAAGDCISVKLTGSGTMTASHLYAAVRWHPTTNYLYPEMAGGTTITTTAVSRYAAIPGYQAAATTATESLTYVLAPNLGSYTMTIANLGVLQSTTNGGTSKAWTLRHGTGTQASINPTCTVMSSLTGCTSANSSVSGTDFSVGDWLDWQYTNTGTQTAQTWHKESFTANVH